jgi:protein-tyrosine phosphatase
MILNFRAACNCEDTVFGAHRPGYHDFKVDYDQINKWIEYVKKNSVERVVCLLSDSELNTYYSVPLLKCYRESFGERNVLWVPVEEMNLCSREDLERIMMFLWDSDRAGKKVVVHCNGGVGRTGFILAAWLVFGRSFDIKAAVTAVKRTGRIPTEACDYGDATYEELYQLLNFCYDLRERKKERDW